MRLLAAIAAVVFAAIVGISVWTTVFRPPPAATRLAGVSVTVAGYTIDDLGNDRHRITLTAVVTSLRDLDECLGFTIDEPFAGRRMRAVTGECPQPRAGTHRIQLLFEGLTTDDLDFPSHTLVWGIPGRRCGPILVAFGVCVVDQAGTTDFQFPSKHPLPSFPGFGSFSPLGPFFSFPPP